jgi:hypothetical protein
MLVFIAGLAGAEDSFGRFRLFSLSVGASILFFLQDDSPAAGIESAPMPVLPVPSFALTFLPLEFGPAAIGIELSADIYMTNYRWSPARERPIPAEIENRSALVIGPVTAAALQFKYFPFRRVGFRLYGGIAGDLRIVNVALDLNEEDLADAREETGKITDYFWSGNRWLYPVLGFGVDIEAASRWDCGIDGRVWIPSNQRAGIDGLPALNEWRVGIGIRATRK